MESDGISELVRGRKLVEAHRRLTEKLESGARIYGLDQQIETVAREIATAEQRVEDARQLIDLRKLRSARKALESAHRHASDLPELAATAQLLAARNKQAAQFRSLAQKALAADDLEQAFEHAQSAAELNAEGDANARLAHIGDLLEESRAQEGERRFVKRGLGGGLAAAILIGLAVFVVFHVKDRNAASYRAQVDQAWEQILVFDQHLENERYRQADGALTGLETQVQAVLSEESTLLDAVSQRRSSEELREGMAGRVPYFGRWISPAERDRSRRQAEELTDQVDRLSELLESRLAGSLPEALPPEGQVAIDAHRRLLGDLGAIGPMLERGDLEPASAAFRKADATTRKLFAATGLVQHEGAWVSKTLLEARLERERREAELAAERKREADRLAKIERQRKAKEAQALAERQARSEALAAAERLKESAYEMGLEFVKDSLKAPASAQFSGRHASSTSVTYDVDTGRFTVRGNVDAQNGFGAMIRKRFSVEVWPNPDRDGYWNASSPVLY